MVPTSPWLRSSKISRYVPLHLQCGLMQGCGEYPFLQLNLYVQSELEGGSGDEMTMSPQQHQPSVVGPSGRTGAVPALIDQGKISVFQGALSSPNRRSLPAFSGYTFVQQQPARRGTIDQQPTTDLREDELESVPYEAAAPAPAFGFPPPQQHQQQQPQHSRPGAHQSFNEPDASMDMNGDGVQEDHYYR